MEEWEVFINKCAHRDLSVDCNFFENALQVAQTVCDKDLAPFEIDWFLESLLVKPMGLLQILSSKFKDSAWSKTLEKAFTLLTLIVEKLPNAEPFYEDISTLCQLALPPRVGGRALCCAARLARRRRPHADEARAHLHALACSDTCQAPRVHLLGVLCEYHPELFSDVRTLWRTFLNLLDSQGSRVSLNIVKFVLEAICGLFKNFGTDLDVIELYEFYDKMAVFLNDSSSHDRPTRKKCFEACCTILEKHSDLFRERVSSDRKLRASLWNSISVGTRPAVIAVYRTCYNYGENLQELASELLAQAESNYPLSKYTALYTLSCVLRRDVTHVLQCDVSRLDAATYGDCEAIACCISANVLNSDRLLQAAILKYESLPAVMRLRTVIYSVLQAPTEIRVPAIKFLTSETCTTQDDKQTDMFMSIWKQLFDSRGGTDAVVLEHSKTVLEDFLTHVIFLLETFLKDEVEVLPPKLSALLKLTAYVLNIQEMDGNALTYSLLRIVEIYAQTYPGAEVVCVVRALAKLEEEGIKAVYGYIDINSCDDEQHLFETCMAMIEAPDGMVDSGQVLTAAKILLSKTDCECAVLSKTVKKLEQVALNHKDELNEDLLNDVIYLVENVRKFNKKDSKDARILHRNTLMFLDCSHYADLYCLVDIVCAATSCAQADKGSLAKSTQRKIPPSTNLFNTDKFTSAIIIGKAGGLRKFSPKVERNKNHNGVLIAGLKELCLNIPVPNEGIAMKLNLHGVLEQALSVEEPEVLHTVMTVICANVRSHPSPEIRAVLSRAWAASARCGSVPSHPALPYGADLLLPYIVNETSPRVRRILLAALQAPLTKGSHIQISGLASNIIMTSEEQCNTSQAKLDLLVLLIRAFKENNLLTQKHLPTVLISVLKTQRSNTLAVFNDISNLLVEKISLFDTETLKKLIRDILNTICNENFKMSSKSKRLIGDAVSFLIKLCDLKSFDTKYLFDVDVRPTPQVLFLLSHLKCDCLLSISFYREYVREKTEFFYNFFELSKRNDSKELVDGIFIALATFCDVLLETHYQKTLDLLARTIKNLCIEHVSYVYKNMSKCLSAVKGVLKKLPHLINNTFSLWLQGQHFEIISEDLARGEDIEHLKLANGLSHIIDAYDVKTCPFCSDLCQIAKNWVKLIYDLVLRGDQMERHYRYFSLLLRISLSLVDKEDVLDIVFKGKPEEAIKFCRSFVPVFSNFLIANHDVLRGELAIVLKDIVEYKVKTDRNDDSVLPVVDKLWPEFEAVSTFEEKHSLLLDLTCLTSKLAPDSNPMRWVVETMACERTSEKEKIKLIAVLPSGDAYSAARRRLALGLPARLWELRGASRATLHALLDNFSATKDAVLLQILSSLADGDPTKGWWDGAMVECMKAIAVDQQLNVEFMSEVYRVCKDGRTGGACERLLIPLLRYSPSPRCEQFFSTILDELFSILKKQPREVAANSVYQKCLLGYTRTFNILRIAFEKIPKQHLESPESQLYSKMASKTERPFFIVYSICVYGVELTKKISCPEGADGNLKDMVRTFHCSVHNCMAAALCCRRPNQSRIYANVFCVDVWRRVVDADKKYDLPLTEDWRQHTTRQAVSIDVPEEVGALSVGTKSRTVHFLRTLSEDPFLYDLPDDEEMVPTQELRLSDCSLNEHECAAIITALLCHVASFDDLMMELCKGLTEGFKNMRWLLAQIVCNCKDELKPLASTLRPALLNVVSNTTEGNKLNRIHIEILKTLISWKDETNELPELSIHDFNTVIKCMILTIKDFRRHQSIVASLLEKLHNISDLYGKYIRFPDECFETTVDQNVAADVKQIELRILKVLAKSRVDITGLLPRIFDIFEADLSESNIELPKLLGVVLSVATPGVAATYAARFRTAVERVRRSSVLNYVKMVYYAQIGYTKCCDEKIIREIVDLVNKIPGKEKQKCLDIIAAYLSVASPGEHIDELFDVLDISQLLVQGLGLDVATQGLPLMQEGLRRRVVSQVVDGHWPSEKGVQDFLLMALEVSLKSSTTSPPAKKRPSVSPILTQQSVLSRLAAGLNDQDALVKVAQCLSNDLAVRFCEAFTIAVYHPLNSHKRGLNYAYLTLELFFHQLRSQDSFKSVKLRDEPLDYGEAKQPNTASTVRSLTQGGLGGRSVTDIQSHEIDVQVPIDDILQSILKFAKCQPSVASAICVEIARVTRSGHTDLTDQLLKLLESNPTPFVVNICRLYVDSCCNVDGFKPVVEKLLSDTRGTEGYDLVAALHQEMRIRSGGLQQFYLGVDTIKVEDVEITEDRPSFSINDLVSCFGKLSNWHDLTIQQRRAVSTSMPVLWTDQNTFKNSLAYYTGGVGWFDAMLAVFRNDSCKHISATLLNKLDAWPRDEFDVSAVTEAWEWIYIRDTSHSEKDLCRLTCNIRKGDCLAKWAARLMLRRLFLKTVDIEADSDASHPENGLERSLSLSHQLEWCKRANEMGLPALALQCLEDVSDIYESEALKWLQQKVIALRTIGLERSDRQKLEDARDLFNRMSQFRQMSSLEDIIGIDYWGLLLLKDLQLPMEDNVNEMMGYLERCVQLSDEISKEFKETLDSVCVLMMTAWHDSWKAEEDDTNCRILGKMAKILQIYVDLKIGPKRTIMADMILKRLDDLDVKILPTEISKDVLLMFNTIKEDLDDFALDVLQKHQHLFPHACEYSQLFKTEDSLASVRQMLATVGDPAHGLLQYCARLRAALHRKEVWWQTFENMKWKIFENPYVGCDYQVLFQYKDVLYGIEEYDTSGPREKEKTLAPIILQLSNELKSADRRTLSLQQLCPKLCERDRTLEPALHKLLWLPDNAAVEFDDTVSVYTDTLNRACVVNVRVCECRRRYIVKGGEPLRRDAAALRGRAALGLTGGYRVTPLSEDCGLIEYLENHERIRNLILNSEGNKTAGLPAMVSSKDQILLSRADAVRQFEQACSEVPAFLLRSAVEQNSTSYEDFISKKSRFVESLSTVTIINWLLGVGDRHLENLMYDYRTGDVCNIDWGAMLQYGEGEIPCSRLTRNLLAVCDTQVLESRLQQILQHMRDNQSLFLAVWHVSLNWMSDFKDRFCILESLLQGTVLSHSATRCALQASQVQNKEKYIALLDEVFADFENKESYSVDEQVSCLLRQSTDPRILSVTRSRWEPWL